MLKGQETSNCIGVDGLITTDESKSKSGGSRSSSP